MAEQVRRRRMQVRIARDKYDRAGKGTTDRGDDGPGRSGATARRCGAHRTERAGDEWGHSYGRAPEGPRRTFAGWTRGERTGERHQSLSVHIGGYPQRRHMVEELRRKNGRAAPPERKKRTRTVPGCQQTSVTRPDTRDADPARAAESVYPVAPPPPSDVGSGPTWCIM